MAEVRNALGEHAEALIADVLDKSEEAIINVVMMKLMKGEPLDPQFALQQWFAISAQRGLRRKLIQRSHLEKSRSIEDL